MTKALNTKSMLAVQALEEALAKRDWGTRIFHSGSMTRRTLAEFAPYEHIPEVKQLVDAIRQGKPVDALLLKYAKRRYVESEDVRHPDDLNYWFEEVIGDSKAVLFKPGADPNSRYLVYSEQHQLRLLLPVTGDG